MIPNVGAATFLFLIQENGIRQCKHILWEKEK